MPAPASATWRPSCVAQPLAGDDDAMPDAADDGLHAGEEVGLVVGALREEDEVRRRVLAAAGEAGGGGEPAGVAAHRLVDEDLGRAVGHRRHVERALAHRDGGVAGGRAEAGAAVGDGKVVVDGLRHADAGQGIAELGGEAGDLERGVGAIVAAVVEKPAHVVRPQHLEQALVARAVVGQRPELGAAAAEGAARGVGEGADRGRGFGGGVDQVLAQRAEDAVAGGQHLDPPGAGGGDHRRRGGVDHGGHAAGLGVEQGACWPWDVPFGGRSGAGMRGAAGRSA